MTDFELKIYRIVAWLIGTEVRPDAPAAFDMGYFAGEITLTVTADEMCEKIFLKSE